VFGKRDTVFSQKILQRDCALFPPFTREGRGGKFPPAGFTLLEVLLAITLLSLVTASLYSSLYIGFKMQRSATTALAPARTAALALELLQQDFDSALRPNPNYTNRVVLAGQFEGACGVGAGQSDTLAFYSAAGAPHENETGGDIRLIQLSVEVIPGDAHPVLLRRVTSNLLASTDPVVRQEVLCRGVKSFNLLYYDGMQWNESWDSAGLGNILPVAVQATLEFLPQPQAQSQAAETYKITRVFMLPCGFAVSRAAQQQ
jgi:prepilin-type N-terminal cleavage/methylation domain-containing protein